MKKKTMIAILLIEILVCISLVFMEVFTTSFTNAFTSVISFPFEQIATILRNLSLSGSIGNAFAVLLFIILCLLPLFILFYIKRKRVLNSEDFLLVLMSFTLFIVIYLMINPYSINRLIGPLLDTSIGHAVLSVVIYAEILGYFILRVIRTLPKNDTVTLLKYMSYVLLLVSVNFIVSIFGLNLSSLVKNLMSTQDSTTSAFITMRYIVDNLPYLFNILIVLKISDLLNELQKDRYSIKTVNAVNSLSSLCIKSLKTIVITSILINLLQIIFIGYLSGITTNVQIPILSIAFILCVLILSSFIVENKELKDDNDMFV